jgi:hypothetical protein
MRFARVVSFAVLSPGFRTVWSYFESVIKEYRSLRRGNELSLYTMEAFDCKGLIWQVRPKNKLCNDMSRLEHSVLILFGIVFMSCI